MSETTSMTLHRALSELKLIDKKIEKQIDEIAPVGIYQKGKLINAHISEEDFSTAAQGKYASVSDLIERKSKIKSAIVMANAKTSVTIAGKIMTIADAINNKASLVIKKKFLNTMIAKYASAVSSMSRNNDVVEQNIQRILEVTFGKDNVKPGKDDADNVRKPYIEGNEYHLFDPLKIKTKIDTLEKEITDFEAEVDAVLSEINAVTKIEF